MSGSSAILSINNFLKGFIETGFFCSEPLSMALLETIESDYGLSVVTEDEGRMLEESFLKLTAPLVLKRVAFIGLNCTEYLL